MKKGLVSVIIPSRNEQFLQRTIQDILEKAHGDIEIFAVLDGYWCKPEEIVNDPRVNYLHRSQARGMRDGINSAAKIANGEYLLKSDGHCMFAPGFDEQLKRDRIAYLNDEGDDNWIVIPRRHRLDAEKWELQVQADNRPPIDYEYLSSPNGHGAKGTKWDSRTREREDIAVDETMSFQGSCWFMTTNHYLNRLGGMSEEGYGQFVREAQEIGLKTWLSGGRVYTNKNTWYAHLHKGKKYGRGYRLDSQEMKDGNAYCDDFWFNNKWDKAKYDLAWFIERFMPVPGWDEKQIEMVRKK